MGGALCNRAFEITAHPHRQAAQPVTRRNFGQQGKVQSRFFVRGRQTHHPPHWQIKLATTGDKPVCIRRQNARLLRLLAGVDLHEHIRTLPKLLCQSRQCGGQLWPVKRMDRVKQLHGLTGFVALQRPNKMHRDILKAVVKTRPFASGILHPILPIQTVALLQHRVDTCIGLNL